MAIKLFCDICKEEIEGQQMASNFKYFEKAEMFTMGGATQEEPQIKQVEQMFCEKCTDEIKKKRDEMVK
ncbi:MAG TPA: hypothetical protein ENI23_01855 [bacterium]|nr:hypothetical protein [bacterium]